MLQFVCLNVRICFWKDLSRSPVAEEFFLEGGRAVLIALFFIPVHVPPSFATTFWPQYQADKNHKTKSATILSASSHHENHHKDCVCEAGAIECLKDFCLERSGQHSWGHCGGEAGEYKVAQRLGPAKSSPSFWASLKSWSKCSFVPITSCLNTLFVTKESTWLLHCSGSTAACTDRG